MAAAFNEETRLLWPSCEQRVACFLERELPSPQEVELARRLCMMKEGEVRTIDKPTFFFHHGHGSSLYLY